MNNHEAKFILGAYRANGMDADDAIFAEALRQSEHDPMLRSWLACEQALDAAIASKMKEIQPPSGLRDAILTGARVSSDRRSSWRSTHWVSLAAAAALLAVTSVALWPSSASADSRLLTAFALNDSATTGHDGHGAEMEALQTLLSDPSLRLSGSLPFDPVALRRSGCRTVQLEGREVYEVCFSRNGAWFHLYAVRASNGNTAAGSGEIEYKQSNGLACASWSDRAAGIQYAVVGSGGLDAIRQIL